MKLYNRNFATGERIEYMGWVNEGIINNNITWQTYKPRFLVLKGTEVMLFESPPVSIKGERNIINNNNNPNEQRAEINCFLRSCADFGGDTIHRAQNKIVQRGVCDFMLFLFLSSFQFISAHCSLGKASSAGEIQKYSKEVTLVAKESNGELDRKRKFLQLNEAGHNMVQSYQEGCDG